MLPLVGLAATIIPDLIRLIARDKSGSIADVVTKTVSDVTKTSDPVEAMKALQSDVAAAAELRVRLAQIAVDAQKAQNDEADKQRQDELATLQASLGDTKDARGTLVALAQSRSGVAWGAPVVSLVVTLGFFVILSLLIFYRTAGTIDPNTGQIINITVGALAAAFATVVNFWLGSSQGSRSKELECAATPGRPCRADQSCDGYGAGGQQAGHRFRDGHCDGADAAGRPAGSGRRGGPAAGQA